MDADLAVITLNIACCVCYVNYELFQGFESSTTKTTLPHTSQKRVNTTTDSRNHKGLKKTTLRSNVTVHHKVNAKAKGTEDGINSTSDEITTLLPKLGRRIHRQFKRKCPETERPMSLGTYEIPTQQDLVLFTKRTLVKMFNSYHEKTLFFLKDIKEATRATIDVEKKCRNKSKSLYKKCVKQVSKRCVLITKDLVASLERQEAEVIALTEDRICDMTLMRTDPIQLIKRLAMDEATMDFALPAFLRLLGGCSTYCQTSLSQPDRRPRQRQLTDQDLVVRHFLSSKNYIQLINDTTNFLG